MIEARQGGAEGRSKTWQALTEERAYQVADQLMVDGEWKSML